MGKTWKLLNNTLFCHCEGACLPDRQAKRPKQSNPKGCPERSEGSLGIEILRLCLRTTLRVGLLRRDSVSPRNDKFGRITLFKSLTVLFYIFVTGILIAYSAPMTCAQEYEPLPAQEGYGLTVDEALDRLEERFESVIEDPIDEDTEEGFSDEIISVMPSEGPADDQDGSAGLHEIKSEEFSTEQAETVPVAIPEPGSEIEPRPAKGGAAPSFSPDGETLSEGPPRPVLGGPSRRADTPTETPIESEDIEDVLEERAAEFEETLETKIIPLLHAEASSIIETLDQMKTPAGEVTYNEQDRTLILKDVPGQLEVMSAYVKGMDILIETEVFKLEYIKVEDIVGDIKKALTEGIGEVQPDGTANSVVVTDTPLKIGEIRELIARADHVHKKIVIKTKILQIVLNDEHMMGVDWEATLSDHQQMPFPGFTVGKDTGKNGRLNLGTVSQEDYDRLLEALDTAGIVHEISDGVIQTEHEETKTVSILSSPLRDLQEADPDASGNNKNTGLLEEILEPPGSFSARGAHEGSKTIKNTPIPQILQSGEVRFDITPSISGDKIIMVSVQPELVGEVSGPAKETLTIRVEDGATVVIGSLFEEVVVESTWKVPLLGDLPLLGFVFRNQGEVTRNAEIVTFLTVRMAEKEK